MNAKSLPDQKLAWSPWEPVDFSALKTHRPPLQTLQAAAAAATPPVADASTAQAANTDDDQLAQLREQAHSQGYAAGHQEGLAAGHEEGRARGHEQGYQDGFAAGQAAGLNQGQEEGRLLAQEAGQQLIKLTQQFEFALQNFDQQLADDTLNLALEIARQMVQEIIKVKPELLLPTLRQALAELPHPQATIVLNPEDAQLVRDYLGEQLGASGHRLREDPHMERGGCLLETHGSEIDATLSTRWRNIVANLGRDLRWLGDEDDN